MLFGTPWEVPSGFSQEHKKWSRMTSMPVDQRPSAITASAKKRQRQKMNESIAKLGLGLGLGDDMS